MELQATTSVIADTLQYIQSLDKIALQNAMQYTAFYKWVAGGIGGAFVLFMLYVLNSWGYRVKELTIAIRTLTDGFASLSKKIDVNRADEIAHRGYCIEKHVKHDLKFNEIDDDIEEVRNDVGRLKGRVGIVEHDIKKGGK